MVISQIEEEPSHETFTAPITTVISSKKNKKRKINKNGNELESILNEDEELLKEAMSVLRAKTDDCDVFGQFVAVELRQIRSEERRRRLKRIIQRAIMDIGEEEDSCENLSSAGSTSCFENNYDCVSESGGSSTTYQHKDYHLTSLSNLSSTSVSHSSDLSDYLKNFNVENYSPSDNPVSVHQTTLDKPLE